MPSDPRAELRNVRTFPSLVRYLRDEMGWPIATADFEELTFEYTPEELGIDSKNAAKIDEIKRLRPLSTRQPWGIFFVKFEPKKLPVVALRRILGQLALKKRASANSAERTAWAADDLLFVSNYGEGDERQISLAHFSNAEAKQDLPTLRVLGWNNLDTQLHLDAVADRLTRDLAWPDDDTDIETWRRTWRSAFTLRHREVVTTSRDLSVRLADLARSIRDRIRSALTIETESGPLTTLMVAFQQALIHDLDADGFADMYAQTIAYGLLSARVANPKGGTADALPLAMPVTSPFLRELMQTFLNVGGRRGSAGGSGIDFDELGVSEVVELLDDSNMEAVVKDFGDKNPEEDPVVHFYELFLKEYDPKKRTQRGVFYTPRSVVAYIVRSADEALRREFALQDGIADTSTWAEMIERHVDLVIPDGVDPGEPFVQVLDPATGTGTFLVEIIDLVYLRMIEKWNTQGANAKEIGALWNEYVPLHLLPRLHGYELLMAPYAIAHLKIGLKLYETGYKFESDERARVYLTNALEPAQDSSDQLAFAVPALAHEALAVNSVKQRRCFTVVLGNPPYSVTSLNSNPFINGLMDSYKKHVRGEQGLVALSDDYLKFVRLGQELLHHTGCGVIGMITNHGYLRGVIHRGMRQELFEQFGQLFVLDLHGDSNIGETPPTGVANENVFDIQQGVAIVTGIERSAPNGTQGVQYADSWGTRSEKYRALDCLDTTSSAWTQLRPSAPAFFLVPFNEAHIDEYRMFLSIDEAMPVNSCGVKTHRDAFLIGFDREELIERFVDVASDDDLGALHARYGVEDTKHWTLANARSKITVGEIDEQVRPITYRPFDDRWIYYNPAIIEKGDSKYPTLRHLLHTGNLALLTSRIQAGQQWNAVFVTRLLAEMKTAESTRSCTVFPLFLADDEPTLQHGTNPNVPRVNFSGRALLAIAQCLALDAGDDGFPLGLRAEEVFDYVYAVFHSPGYRTRYAEFLKSDFPRLPLPASIELFRELGSLGSELVAVHLLEAPSVDRSVASYVGPERPTVGRVDWSDDTVWLDALPGNRQNVGTEQGMGFRGVSQATWNFRVGGYRVCEKWLKARKGRTLSEADLGHFQRIVAALDATVRLMTGIDEVIEQHGGWPTAFATDGDASQS